MRTKFNIYILLLSLGRYHLPRSQCFDIDMVYYYHWVDTSASRLLVPEDIIRPEVSVLTLTWFITITGLIPLLVDH